MATEQMEFVDLVEVTHNNIVEVRTKKIVRDNGIEISSALERRMVVPGDDYSAEDAKVKTICLAVHTSAVIAAYQVAQAVAQAQKAAQLPQG